MKNRVNKVVEELSAELKAMTRDIHDHPELGLEEYHACEVQKKILEKYGFKVETGYCGMDTAYKAVYKGAKPGPKIGMLAEYDALPDIGHGCGHNLVAMVGVGSGIAMREFADEFGGDIYVIGTPAEETTGGKVPMANAGIFDDLDVVMMSHPFQCNSEAVNTLAVNTYTIKFYGKVAHASSSPYEGLNALDAVINFYNLVNALRQETQPDARIHGIITEGGKAPNIIPDYTEALIFVRAEKVDYLEVLSEKVLDCARGAALGTGTRVEIVSDFGNFLDTNSNWTLSHLNASIMKDLGIEMKFENNNLIPGSSDMGNVSYRCPAIQTAFDISQGEKLVGHTKDFAKAAVSDYALNQGLTFIKGFVLTAIELMTNPEKMKEIQDEFAKISRR